MDVLVIVGSLADAREKHVLELEISKSLRHGLTRKPVDVIVLDVDIVYDEVGVPGLVDRVACEVVEEGEYVVFKNGRRLDLHAQQKLD